MIDCSTIFTQLLEFLPYHRFRALVRQHKSDWKSQRCNTWNHFVILLYAQATNKDSLREIELGLKTNVHFWHHLGIKTVARSTIAYMNRHRDSIVFEELFYEMLERCMSVTSERVFPFKNQLYSLDSTTISLCLSLCDWAKFRQTKGAIKLHTLFNNRLHIPEIIHGTTGSVNDGAEAKRMLLKLEIGSIIVFDRGYPDQAWWKELDAKGYFFVTRTKKNTRFIVSARSKELEPDILSDDTVWIGDVTDPVYPKEIRLIRFLHKEKGELVFLTNNFDLKASEIALVYKERWQIELFFKWIKQNLVIKSFLGTSKNAIMNQVWVAMIFYLIVAYIRFQTRYPGSMLELTWLIKEALFVRRPLLDLLSLSKQTIRRVTEDEAPTLF
jgi:Transposase DDE domain/Domain of unknown function (DUF4372)